MKFSILAAVLGATLGLTGCSELGSLNPVAAEGEAKLDPALPGVWEGSDGLFVIRQEGPGYRVVFISKDTSMKFRAVFFQVGSAKLLDVISEDDHPFHVPVHVLVRVWPEPAKLRWAILDTDWLKQQARDSMQAQVSGDRTLLSAAAPALRGFVTKYAGDEKAYKEPNVLERVY